MHIPNGFLSDPVCLVTSSASAAALGGALWRLRSDRTAPDARELAAAAAGIFTGQMLNFTIHAGTSGHLVGAALAAIVLGPWAGMLTMSVVLATQCLLFGDGGWHALGANVLNMAVIGTLVGYGVNAAVHGAMPGRGGKLVAASIAAWISVMAGAIACSLELAASGLYPLASVLPAMAEMHALIGIGEAIITTAVLVLLTVGATRGIGLLKRTGAWRFAAITGGAALAAAVLLSPLASTYPDGLERVAIDLGFAGLTRQATAIAADYQLSGVDSQPLALTLAVALGLLGVYAGSYGVGRAALARSGK